MRIPKAVLGGFLVLVLVAAAVYFFVLDKSPAAPATPAETPAGASSAAPSAAASPDQKVEAAPLPVKVSKAFLGDLVMTLKSPGEAYTEKRVAVKAEVGGVVKNLYAAEGRHVREGDLLVELDDREYRLNLERLEAQRLRYLSELFLERQFSVTAEAPAQAIVDKLAKAQADYDRVAQGFKSGVASQADLEKAQASLELALIEAGRKKDEVQAATKGLTQAEVDVKIARLSSRRPASAPPSPGSSPTSSSRPRSGSIRAASSSRSSTSAASRSRPRSSRARSARSSPAARSTSASAPSPAGRFTGRIEAVSPVINAEDKTCGVYVTMDNPSEEIKPGMHAEVEFPTEIFTGRLLVPQQAILVRGGRKLVFAVEGDIAKWRYIEVGLENEKFAEVLPGKEPGWGVAAGDTVIIEGHITLAHDTKVSIVQ